MIISRVKQLMEEREMTYQDLVAKTGLSTDTVARIRNDHIRECRLYTLEIVATALGVTTKDLYDELDSREASVKPVV